MQENNANRIISLKEIEYIANVMTTKLKCQSKTTDEIGVKQITSMFT